ncbi:MAG: family 10 glycosylhydrolase [Firmicutes bacterium]|nr:family 10 glycosylhydrolase [Bacillota bacterium]
MSGNQKTEQNENKRGYYDKRKKIMAVIALAIAVVFVIWTVAASLMSVWADNERSVDLSNAKMKGIWVSTVANLDFPAKATTDPAALKTEIDNILTDCAHMGMNTIFLQVRPASDSLYPSQYFPWSKYLTGTQGVAPADGFDPLAYWIAGAHSRGMELHAWLNPYRVTKGGDKDLAAMAATHPVKKEYADSIIKYEGEYYFDPAQPKVRRLITDAALEIVRNYDVDGIHMDDYFYPGTDFNDDASYAVYGAGQDKADWRRDNVNQLIKMMDQELHAADSTIEFGISPTGIWANASSVAGGSDTAGLQSYLTRYADSVTWIKNGWVDYIAPQIYWNIGYKVADYSILADWWADVVAGTDVDLYIGMADYRVTEASGSSSPWYGTAELNRQLVINRSNPNIAGEIHFRYKLMAGRADIMEFYHNAYGTTVPNPNPTPDPQPTPQPEPAPEPEPQPTPDPTPDPEPAPSNPSGLTDISGHWAEQFIKPLVEAGVISGMGDGTFQPNANITRAQFVKLIAGIAGDIDFSEVKSAGFSDVPDSEWYAQYVNWAASNGIVNGMDDKTFRPNANITREQMASIINNLYDALKVHMKTDSPLIEFADKSQISSWAADSVNAAVKGGILNGVADGNKTYFKPQGLATRGEAAKVIYVIRDEIK